MFYNKRNRKHYASLHIISSPEYRSSVERDMWKQLITFILMFQARAPDSIVLIVGTFYDRLSVQQKKNNFVEDMRRLIFKLYVAAELGGDVSCPRERGLPKVVQVIDVSCTTGYNVDKLRQAIYNAALEIKGPG